MYKYTLKLDAEGGLSLTDGNGEAVTGAQFLRQFYPHRVFALYGEMGAGKTTFLTWLCGELGVADTVNSPTFAIVNVYDLPPSDVLPLAAGEEMYHFDCYRLKNVQEALEIGTEDYLYSGCYCFIEWPDVIEQLLPPDTVVIRFRVEPTGERVLEAV
ncbi:MAG: tRNA (adenosine(37)-N6)-threonylcarbamoyltransferase complex ATPase subunit type 1 TsaE [Paludibacteraceae bacterium]|nr:tRNA (adenosine(37)-N6)-threonylcarbamoyltransferase complex ATPase subunit type 1 TsaE [Paludibacteraceae bacterium]